MTPAQAAQRLGVHETAVRTVVERENDCVATLRDESRWLISDTVSRPYVPEVDDVAVESDEPDGGAEISDKPKPVAKKAAARAGKAA